MPPRHPPPPDVSRSNIWLIVGRKGSGKSVYARTIFDGYPYSKIAVDPSGDAKPTDPRVEQLKPPFPRALTPADDGRPRIVHARVNPVSPSYADDMDRALSMALYPSDQPCLVWLDEAGMAMTAQSTPPHLRTALMSSRHHGPVSLILCGPRPMHISALSISQADQVIIYDLPNPADVGRLAENMGYTPSKLQAAVEVTRQRNADERERSGGAPYWHLVYDRGSQGLWRMPPLDLPRDHQGPKS